MKVTVVVNSYARDPIGGVGVVYHYANHMVGHGHTVTVVHVARNRWPNLRDGKPRRQLEEFVGACRSVRRGAPESVSWLEINPAVDMRYVPRLVARDVPDGDAVIATGWQSADGVAGLPSSKGAHCYLIQHHETWSGSERRVDSTWRLPMRRIFIAPWLYSRALGMGLEDSHRVPGAIDTKKFHVSRPIDERPKRVAMLWSEWAWKGGGEGVAALVEARCSVPDLQAVLFGAGPRPADLPAWIEYEQNPPQDKLVVEIYNGSSIYLCPSHAEGWHLPPAEAMASGCAVVSTDIDGVADYALAGETALLSPPHEAQGLADNLVGLLTDEPARLRLAHAAHRHIQQFTWERSTHQLEAVLAPAVKEIAAANATGR